MLSSHDPHVDTDEGVNTWEAVFPPKGGTRVLPPPFLTWFPLMWSLECLICFDLKEKLYLSPPPLSFFTWGKHWRSHACTINGCTECLIKTKKIVCASYNYALLVINLSQCYPHIRMQCIHAWHAPAGPINAHVPVPRQHSGSGRQWYRV